MTFSRQRAPGAWISGVPMATGEAEAFDGNLAKAIDGDGGGTYAPSTQIIIGGSGFKVTGAFDVSGAAAFTGTVECKAGLSVTTAGTFSCSRAGTFSNGLTVSTAGSFTCSRPATFSDGLAIDTAGDFTCSRPFTLTNVMTTDHLIHADAGVLAFGVTSTGAVQFNTTLNVDGNATFNAYAYLNGRTFLAERLVLSGLGRLAYRTTTPANANVTLGVDTVDEIFLSESTGGGGYTVTISTTAALPGSRIRISRDYDAPTGNWTVSVPAYVSGSAFFLMGANASTECRSIELTFDGTNWRRTGFSKTSTT